MDKMQFNMRRSMRATLMAETLINIKRHELGQEEHAFALTCLEDTMIYAYSVIQTSNPPNTDNPYTYAQFVLDMDEPAFAKKINDWFAAENEQIGELTKKKTKAKRAG